MELAFDSKELRKICEDSNYSKGKLGDKASGHLQGRLADLVVANSVKDIIVGRPRVLNEESDAKYKIDLCNNYRLVFSANHHPKNPRTENGEVDWQKVRNIKILAIDKIDEQIK